MSLFRSSLRPPTIASDEAFERYLAGILGAAKPDPVFRRRLRGLVLNEYVAAREGVGQTRARRQMGKLGRAALHASFSLALSVTGVLAVSQESVPGDLLYPVKLRIEELRLEVLPEQLHDDLAAYALEERIVELGRLSERGVTSAVAVLAATIEDDYAAFVADAADEAGAAKHLVVLKGLLTQLPEPAQVAIKDVVEDAIAVGHSESHGGQAGEASQQAGVSGQPPRAGVSGQPPHDGPSVEPKSPNPTPEPNSPKPEATTPGPEPTVRPTPTVRQTPTPRPTPKPTPRSTPAGQLDADAATPEAP